IKPEHISCTTITTPDGNMVNHVIQQVDCNAPATYQALMNYLFTVYLGQFLDVYLDDIIIYIVTDGCVTGIAGVVNQGKQGEEGSPATINHSPPSHKKELGRNKLVIRLLAKKKQQLPDDRVASQLGIDAQPMTIMEHSNDEALAKISQQLESQSENLTPLTLKEFLNFFFFFFFFFFFSLASSAHSAMVHVTKDNIIYLKTDGRKLLCIPAIIVCGHTIRERVILEAHSLLAHLGLQKTLLYLHNQV
ncbi:hypothetical protein J132_01047, partial [Termitomyces sp. J132]